MGVEIAKDLRGSEKGVALFMVLWVLALLSVMVGEFCYTMRTDLTMTWDFGQRTKAYYIAYAGMQRALAQLLSDLSNPFKVKKGVEDEDEEEEPGVHFRLNYPNPEVPFGKGTFRVHIENESGKININKAGRRLLRAMLSPFNLEDDQVSVIVDSILDWRDKDKFHRLNGAEDDYYQSLPQPYECKDDYFDSVEELLLVRGITKEIFYGGLRDMVTVYLPKKSVSRRKSKRAKRRFSYNKINLNAASEKVLACLPGMTKEAIEAIKEYRKEKDFTTVAQLAQVVDVDVYRAAAPYLDVQLSPLYTVESTGRCDEEGAEETISAVIQIDRTAPKGYVIVRWRDKVEAAMSY